MESRNHMPNIEELVPVLGHDKYFVDRCGNVYSAARTTGPLKLLRSGLKKPGRLQVSLGDNKWQYVHAVVCSAFHGPRPPGMEVRHLDGNSLNNNAENLAWGTRADNCRDDKRLAARKGLSFPRLSPEAVGEIFASVGPTKDLAKKFNVVPDTIREIRRGRRVSLGLSHGFYAGRRQRNRELGIYQA